MKGKISYLGLLFVVFILYLWTNDKSAFWLLSVMIAIVPILFLYNLITAPFLNLSVTMEKLVSKEEGRELVIDFSCQNISYLPVMRLCMEGRMRNCLTGSVLPFFREISVGPRSNENSTIRVSSDFCGKIEVILDHVTVRDFLGIFQREIKNTHIQECYIYPGDTNFQDFEIDMTVPEEINIQNRYLHRKGNDITEILHIREYEKGDSIKTIHWKLSKKMNEKMVRELDTPVNQDIIVFIALSEKMREDPVLRDRLAETACGLSQGLLEDQKLHDALLFRYSNGAVMKYNIEGKYQQDLYERSILEGDLSFSTEDVENYIKNHAVIHKYSFVMLVTDQALEGWLSEYSNVRQIIIQKD